MEGITDQSPISWALLDDDVLRACLRINLAASMPNGRLRVQGLLSAAATCKSWRQVADGDELWTSACTRRWPEVAGLENVASQKALYRRMNKADQNVGLRETPSELQFMVRLRMGLASCEEEVVLAHSFKWSDMSSDGTWECPPLNVSSRLLIRAAEDIAARDLTHFKGFFDWFHSELTVTVFRSLDGRIARMLPQTPPDLPSSHCIETDYEEYATFTGFEERVANASIVLGAQFTPARAAAGEFPEPEEMLSSEAEEEESDGDDTAHELRCLASTGAWKIERIKAYVSGLRLRLGYWPTANFFDQNGALIDWQARFEASSSDRLGFATFVHCLLDGAAEYSWLDAHEPVVSQAVEGRAVD